jgi:hypothetical protein
LTSLHDKLGVKPISLIREDCSRLPNVDGLLLQGESGKWEFAKGMVGDLDNVSGAATIYGEKPFVFAVNECTITDIASRISK